MLSIIKGPYLQWPTRSAMTIMWETSCPASSQVAYYETKQVSHGLNGRFETLRGSQKMTLLQQLRH